jgi:putative peptide zinc metalloprotease protein
VIPQFANPLLDPNVKMGPLEERAGTKYFFVKHLLTSRMFRIGEREQFVMSCMDGTKSIEEIARLYETKFHSRMTEASWQQLYKMLLQRSLMKTDQASVPSAADHAPRRLFVSRQGFLEWRFRLINPVPILRYLAGALSFVFRPSAVVCGLLVILASEIWVGLHLHDIYVHVVSAGHGHWGRLACYVVPVFFLSSVVHELAHALTCEHFGGSVTDVGIVFRYLNFYPYTQLDDVMLFHNRLHRIYVLSAGMFATLLLSVPFIGWWIVGSDPFFKAVSGAIILALAGGTFFNLIPFIQLDGYWILTSILRMPDLRQDSYIFLKAIALRILRLRSGWPSYSRREIAICAVYGSLSAVITLYAMIGAGFHWHLVFTRLMGASYSWLAVVALVITFAVLQFKRSETELRKRIGARVAGTEK